MGLAGVEQYADAVAGEATEAEPDAHHQRRRWGRGVYALVGAEETWQPMMRAQLDDGLG